MLFRQHMAPKEEQGTSVSHTGELGGFLGLKAQVPSDSKATRRAAAGELEKAASPS